MYFGLYYGVERCYIKQAPIRLLPEITEYTNGTDRDGDKDGDFEIRTDRQFTDRYLSVLKDSFETPEKQAAL